MNDFFRRIYELFFQMKMWGADLQMHLQGLNDNGQYDPDLAMFGFFGLRIFISGVILACLFYYLINHPRFNRLLHWLVVLLINGFITFLIPYIVLTDHKYKITGRIANGLEVSDANIIGFAWANVILGVIVFVVISFIIRWWSRNCSCTPYPL